ncbi:MAG: GrpB family protein [bacterium]|nr:GrpB family protein [bacterium]
MKKKVTELTQEEFQKTFPIILTEHNQNYKEWYEVEKNNILSVVDKNDVIRINHIGSSAIEGLIAKPIIDILLEIDGSCNVTKLLSDLKTIGFGEELSTRTEDPFRVLLAKGMSSDGFSEKVYFLHVRYLGDWKELYFRDFLIAHPDVAREYGELKENILKDIESGKIERMPNGQPNGYSQAKLSFVEKVSMMAKEEFKERYKPC